MTGNAMNSVREALEAVILARSTTTIIYNGGSAPGTARAISPISVSGDILVARCLETDRRKTFQLAKVSMVGSEPITLRPLRPQEDNARMERLQAMDLAALFHATVELARSHGWALTLFAREIRATRAWETASIAYLPTIQGSYVDADCQPIEVASERPWHVNGKLYVHKNRAFAAFQDALPVA